MNKSKINFLIEKLEKETGKKVVLTEEINESANIKANKIFTNILKSLEPLSDEQTRKVLVIIKNLCIGWLKTNNQLK